MIWLVRFMFRRDGADGGGLVNAATTDDGHCRMRVETEGFWKDLEQARPVSEHAVFQRFWAAARPDTFAPSSEMLASRRSKLH